MAALGFYIKEHQPTSTLPNPISEYTFQRAVLSGYVTSEVYERLYQELPCDLSVDESMTLIAADDPRVQQRCSYASPDDTLPFSADVVPILIVDTNWDRTNLYLFEEVIKLL